MKGVKNLQFLLRNVKYNDDNFHRIAISSLDDNKRKMERWFSHKYRTPSKEFNDYTEEEMYIEMLEDFYEKNPSEIGRFFDGLEDWDGETSVEHETGIKKRLKELGEDKVDIEKYKSDNESYSNEDFMRDLNKVAPVKKTFDGFELDKEYDVLGEDE